MTVAQQPARRRGAPPRSPATAGWVGPVRGYLSLGGGTTGAREGLRADPAAAAEVGEILRELLVNAVRHGRATRAAVSVGLVGANIVN